MQIGMWQNLTRFTEYIDRMNGKWRMKTATHMKMLIFLFGQTYKMRKEDKLPIKWCIRLRFTDLETMMKIPTTERNVQTISKYTTEIPDEEMKNDDVFLN